MVAIITEAQKNILVGKQFDTDLNFNPIQDANDNWVISEIEYFTIKGLYYLDELLNNDLIFIKDLELVEFLPKEMSPINFNNPI